MCPKSIYFRTYKPIDPYVEIYPSQFRTILTIFSQISSHRNATWIWPGVMPIC